MCEFKVKHKCNLKKNILILFSCESYEIPDKKYKA